MSTNYPVNPRVRAYGKARIDIAERVKNPEDWDRLWSFPLNSFPFTWGEPWKLRVEYKVSDFAAEVGFFIDVLGLSVYALNSDIAIFTSPEGDFFFSISSDQGSKASSEPNSFRFQFMVSDILATVKELEKRGIVFELPPQPLQSDSPLIISYFRTPNGVIIDLWGTAISETTSSPILNLAKKGGDEDDSIDDGDKDDEESEVDDESLLGTDEDDLSEDEDEEDEMLIAEEELEPEDESAELQEFEDDIEEDEDALDFEFEEDDEFEDDEED